MNMVTSTLYSLRDMIAKDASTCYMSNTTKVFANKLVRPLEKNNCLHVNDT